MNAASHNDNRQPGPAPDTLWRWHRIVRDLPDVRMEKVRATREALKDRKYDREDVLNETVRRLRNDIEIRRGRTCQADTRRA